jgi:phosphotransferase system HPr (HPr) family protein
VKETSLTVNNETGLHSRPADLFVRTAKLHESNIYVYKGEKWADAKNIIKVILLNVSQGDEIRITAEGPDEEKVIEELQTLIDSDFQKVNENVTI